MSEKLVLIDGHSILNRAFYGVPDLSNSEGLHTNAIYGFLNILFKLLEEEKPEYLTVAFDVKAPTFRHEMYPEYKGTRKPMPQELHEQVPVMKQVLHAMGIRTMEQPGLEADDILGTLAKRAEKEGMDVSLVSGDRDLLQIASDKIKIRIPDAILGRNGGDEFCVLLPNYTFEEAESQLQQFTSLPKTFSCRGREQQFYISLGYAEYPTFASSLSQLMRCADAALYEIKLHGKNGCMSYSKKLQSVVRKQLGFALRDISEHLPGAFIIYRADKEDDELFYANHEFLSMTGYQSMDEFFRLTNKSFHNLIREDEQQQIEASIWKQIDSGNENDYIHFHLRKADGSYLSVLDHGRIVESPQYGKVFYVLFMDWEDMHIHYSDKFSG